MPELSAKGGGMEGYLIKSVSMKGRVVLQPLAYFSRVVAILVFSTLIVVGCGGGATKGSNGPLEEPTPEEPVNREGSVEVSNNSLDIIIAENISTYPISGTCNFDSESQVADSC